jgi:hypothetical protein
MDSDNTDIINSAGQVFLTVWNFPGFFVAVCIRSRHYPELKESNRNLPNLVL